MEKQKNLTVYESNLSEQLFLTKSIDLFLKLPKKSLKEKFVKESVETPCFDFPKFSWQKRVLFFLSACIFTLCYASKVFPATKYHLKDFQGFGMGPAPIAAVAENFKFEMGPSRMVAFRGSESAQTDQPLSSASTIIHSNNVSIQEPVLHTGDKKKHVETNVKRNRVVVGVGPGLILQDFPKIKDIDKATFVDSEKTQTFKNLLSELKNSSNDQASVKILESVMALDQSYGYERTEFLNSIQNNSTIRPIMNRYNFERLQFEHFENADSLRRLDTISGLVGVTHNGELIRLNNKRFYDLFQASNSTREQVQSVKQIVRRHIEMKVLLNNIKQELRSIQTVENSSQQLLTLINELEANMAVLKTSLQIARDGYREMGKRVAPVKIQGYWSPLKNSDFSVSAGWDLLGKTCSLGAGKLFCVDLGYGKLISLTGFEVCVILKYENNFVQYQGLGVQGFAGIGISL